MKELNRLIDNGLNDDDDDDSGTLMQY